MKERLEYFAFAGTAVLLRMLPLRAVRTLAKAIGAFLYTFIPIRKELTLAQLRQSFPGASEEEIQRWGKGSYINLLTTIFELMWTPRFTDEVMKRTLHVPHPEVITGALERGKGLILMSGHFGNWEWLSIGTAALLGMQFHVIVHPMQNPRVDMLVEGYRSSKGNPAVPMGLAVRDIITTLHSNGTVAMLADQSAPKESQFVDFMGRPAATFEGPAVFALKTGAPIVIGFSMRRPDGNYDVVLEEVETADLTGGATQENIIELTQRHVRALEEKIRERPDLWLWQHKRWKHRPPEEASEA